MIVVDASVVAVALADDGPDGVKVREVLSGQTLVAPELIDLEIVSVLRRQVRARSMVPRRAELALLDLAELPMKRAAHRPLLARCWELRASVTAYDAAYVALAEALEVVLVTADRRVARAPGIRCPVEIIS
ncbi:type II toxin-antitoxin system VapC family toxin [Candidatus Mycolicibacterium alkanivorans]|uniref:Ribonuclease VapC n=1 Tax=Candidatus Mycolicibacterium alkanivorans TaxID=2954114 RepID=A0ABS9YUV7_9MYCO|nr:type II toxin-antitoxin system VapC family toxin [Candidatus Mycolicibacterium alkanivorans]MCI4674599.1 type II toxin-antitoxin system VapC family toxin [Candidatus Mycolicibacterium alkanivorans]